MHTSSRTPEGDWNNCPVCGNMVNVEPSVPPGDAPCPNCGSLLWFARQTLRDNFHILPPNATVQELAATTAADAIREIVEQLAAAGAIDRAHQPEIEQALVTREELGSTSIGIGFAVPHAKHHSIKQLLGAMAVSRTGVDFQTLNHRPVNTIILLLSPPDRPADYLRVLQSIARHARSIPA